MGKLDQVFANIARTEIDAMEMKSWIDTLPMHSYDFKKPVRVEETSANGDLENNIKLDVEAGIEGTTANAISDEKTVVASLTGNGSEKTEPDVEKEFIPLADVILGNGAVTDV